VSLQLSQAYSTSESANGRTSAFSAPYNIIFTSTKHNFAKFDKSSGLKPVPIKASLPSTIVVSGIATTSLSNEIILQTPSNQFISYFIV